MLLSCHPLAFHSWDPSLAWPVTFRGTDNFENSHKAVGQLQMFSLLHLRCWGGDAGADHLCPPGARQGGGWHLLVKAGRRGLSAVGEAGALRLLDTINQSRFWPG